MDVESTRLASRGLMAAFLATTLFSLASCDTSDHDRESAYRARLQIMREAIEELIGDAPCSDPVNCRSIGFGSKPCGGFWEYLVYSDAAVDTVALKSMVAKYNEYEDWVNSQVGQPSDCSVPIRPEVGCQNGRCVEVTQQRWKEPGGAR